MFDLVLQFLDLFLDVRLLGRQLNKRKTRD
jgi:hypothetical protein